MSSLSWLQEGLNQTAVHQSQQQVRQASRSRPHRSSNKIVPATRPRTLGVKKLTGSSIDGPAPRRASSPSRHVAPPESHSSRGRGRSPHARRCNRRDRKHDRSPTPPKDAKKRLASPPPSPRVRRASKRSATRSNRSNSSSSSKSSYRGVELKSRAAIRDRLIEHKQISESDHSDRLYVDDTSEENQLLEDLYDEKKKIRAAQLRREQIARASEPERPKIERTKAEKKATRVRGGKRKTITILRATLQRTGVLRVGSRPSSSWNASSWTASQHSWSVVHQESSLAEDI